jgi:hypothetical protein
VTRVTLPLGIVFELHSYFRNNFVPNPRCHRVRDPTTCFPYMFLATIMRAPPVVCAHGIVTLSPGHRAATWLRSLNRTFGTSCSNECHYYSSAVALRVPCGGLRYLKGILDVVYSSSAGPTLGAERRLSVASLSIDAGCWKCMSQTKDVLNDLMKDGSRRSALQFPQSSGSRARRGGVNGNVLPRERAISSSLQ